MDNFSIFAHGGQLDADELLHAIPLRFDIVWRRGDRISSCVGGHYETSGVEIILGCGETLPIREQERVAEAFITANRDALHALARHPNVDCCVLGLQYHVSFKPKGRRKFCVCPSLRLLRLADDVGIRSVVYGTVDHE